MMGDGEPQASSSSRPPAAKPEVVTLSTSDRFPTRAAFFHPAASHDPHAAAVVIAPGTGVPGVHYYGHFASYLASHGHPALVFDYRWSGISFPPGVDTTSAEARTKALVDGKDANISTHWRIDTRAAIRAMYDRYCSGRRRELVYIGNSAGLWVLPLAIPERDLVDRALGVSSFFPHHYYLPDPEERRLGLLATIEASREKGFYLTHLVGKNITDELRRNGKQSSLPSFGADMSLAMGEEWHRWCNLPRCIASEHQDEFFSYQTRSPLVVMTFTDDVIAGGKALASDQLLGSLPLSRSHRLLIDPAKMGAGWEAGCRHVDAFREAQRHGAWEAMRRWAATGEEPRGGGVERREFGGTWEAVEADGQRVRAKL